MFKESLLVAMLSLALTIFLISCCNSTALEVFGMSSESDDSPESSSGAHVCI
jgi:hypothetical protein